MKRVGSFAFMCLSFALAVSAAAAAELGLDEKLRLLVAAYPETIAGVDDGRLTFRGGGEPLLIDDGKVKDHFARLEKGDVEDSLSQRSVDDAALRGIGARSRAVSGQGRLVW